MAADTGTFGNRCRCTGKRARRARGGSYTPSPLRGHPTRAQPPCSPCYTEGMHTTLRPLDVCTVVQDWLGVSMVDLAPRLCGSSGQRVKAASVTWFMPSAILYDYVSRRSDGKGFSDHHWSCTMTSSIAVSTASTAVPRRWN